MIKSIQDNYKIYGLIIVKVAKKLLVLDYGFSNATFETPNHAFAQQKRMLNIIMWNRYIWFLWILGHAFWVVNVPSMFKTLMNLVFHEKLDEFFIIYIDDIFVYSRTIKKKMAHLDVWCKLKRNIFFSKQGK